MITNESRRERNRLFGAGVVLSIFVALSAFQINIPSGVAHPVVGLKGAIFDIVPTQPTAGSSVVVPGSTPGGTFFLIGKIYPYRTVNQADCTLPAINDLGTWRAWGTVGDDGKLVLHQTLALTPFNSTIEVQGTTGLIAPNGGVGSAGSGSLGPPTTGPSEILAVVGGTGRYEGLSGQASIRPYCNPSPTGTTPFRYDRARSA